jgi:predicted GIY-YIG superfamily endonuclease
MTVSIYILLLEGGKYYVGKTEDVLKRYQQHLDGEGSAWTKKYPPVKLVKTVEGSAFDEDKITKEYMAKYGIENVRGGSYCQIQLSDAHMATLKMEIWCAQDRCSQCGRDGHFVKDCYAKTDVCGNGISHAPVVTKPTPRVTQVMYECSTCDRTFTTAFGCKVHERSCEPEEWECEWECDYCDRTFTTEYGCRVHERSCKPAAGSCKPSTGSCYRCGRAGHYSPDCYASTHKKGYAL